MSASNGVLTLLASCCAIVSGIGFAIGSPAWVYGYAPALTGAAIGFAFRAVRELLPGWGR